MEHLLVIGGSGILRGLCCYCANEGKAVSVIARTKGRIVEMVAETQKAPGLIVPLAMDYTQIDNLRDKLDEAAAHLGPPAMTFLRILPEFPEPRITVAGFLNDNAPGSRLFDLICGESGHSRPAAMTPGAGDKFEYRRIIIGRVTSGDHTRPLTEKELLSGILEAIKADRSEFMIGTI